MADPFREQDLLAAIRSLTRREREVMRHGVAGLPNQQIAGEVGASETNCQGSTAIR